jgi:hypothetical protein
MVIMCVLAGGGGAVLIFLVLVGLVAILSGEVF